MKNEERRVRLRSSLFASLSRIGEFMENGIIIGGHTFKLIDDSAITRCDDCALLDKCCDFWIIAEGGPKLCTFLYGEKANNKRFIELKKND